MAARSASTINWRHATAIAILVASMMQASVQAVDNNPPSPSTSPRIDLSTGLTAVVAVGLGAILCFAGYRTLHIALFACGFVFGGAAVQTLITSMFQPANTSIVICAYVLGGLLLGLLAMKLLSVGIFLIGATGGVLIAYAFSTAFAHKIYPERPTIVLLALAIVLGLVGGALVSLLERPIIVLSTSYIGAVAMSWGVGCFAGNFPTPANLKRYRRETIGQPIMSSLPSAWWIYATAIVLCFGLGAAVQFHLIHKSAPREMYRFDSTSRHEAKMKEQSLV